MNQHNPDDRSPEHAQQAYPVARPAAGPPVFATAAHDSSGNWWAPWPITPLEALGDLAVVAGVILLPQLAMLLLGIEETLDEASISAMRLMGANALNWAMVAAVGVYLTYRAGQPLSSIGLRRERLGSAVGAGLLAAGAMFGVTIVTAVILWVATQADREAMTEPAREIYARLGTPTWGTIFLVAATAAVFEEIIFRGFMLTRLRVLVGSWGWAIGLGMIVFAVPHMWQGWVAVVRILPVALVLSLTFVWRRGLAAPIVAHFLFNFLQLATLRGLQHLPEFQKLMHPAGG